MTQLKIFSSICLQVFKIFVDFTLLHEGIGGDTRPLDIVGHDVTSQLTADAHLLILF